MLRPFFLHALSPLHAGTGHSTDIIDFPIARVMGTGIPIATGSGIKGVLRDARKEKPQNGSLSDWSQRHLATFGSEKDHGADYAGALNVSDARLLALPVPSFKGVFVWVTSPLLLTLAKRDLRSAGGAWAGLPIPQIQNRGAKVSRDDCTVSQVAAGTQTLMLYIRDLDLPAEIDDAMKAWAAMLQREVFGNEEILKKRLVAVDDDTMAFLCETATQIDLRIRLKDDTRTVDEGALWHEESLPPETLLIGILESGPGRGHKMSCEEVMEFALGAETTLQYGGKASVGRGRCRMIPVEARKVP